MLMSSKISKPTRKPRRQYLALNMSSIGPVKKVGTATVCGVEYRVLEGVGLQTHNSEDANEVRGAVNAHQSTIILDSLLSRTQKELTLLHELLHAIDDSLNVGLSEAQVGLLGAGLYGLSYKGSRKRDKSMTMKGVFYG